MFLTTSCCIICEKSIPKIIYNLKTTYTIKSKVLMIKLIEKFYKNIHLLHCNICAGCHDLLNELDTIQKREKEIYDQLKSCISKVDKVKRKTDESDSEINFKIEDIDLKKLPIKVKRVTAQRQQNSIEKTGDVHPLQPSKDENEKAFERIQSTIQMNLSKHIEEYQTKSKPVKNILCEICGENFKTKCGYHCHMKKHDSIEDDKKLLSLSKTSSEWSCDLCRKNFKSKSSLSRHRFVHTGETRFQCDQCGKEFVHYSSFNMHKKIHAGVRNYKCEECQVAFLTKSHLQRHIRSMPDKHKRYVCVICDKMFKDHYKLGSHLKAAHKESITIEGVIEEDHPKVYYRLEKVDDEPRQESTTDGEVVYMIDYQ